jgi:hypothetical protein
VDQQHDRGRHAEQHEEPESPGRAGKEDRQPANHRDLKPVVALPMLLPMPRCPPIATSAIPSTI